MCLAALLPLQSPGAEHEPEGNCWAFFSSLKKEQIKKQIYKNRELALNDVTDYIDRFYNPTCRHGHLGGLTPRAVRSCPETTVMRYPLNPGNSTSEMSDDRSETIHSPSTNSRLHETIIFKLGDDANFHRPAIRNTARLLTDRYPVFTNHSAMKAAGLLAQIIDHLRFRCSNRKSVVDVTLQDSSVLVHPR